MFSGFFPSSLPAPLISGYQVNPLDQTIRTEMDIGTARQRRRSAARNDRITVRWRFTDVQMALFRAWVENQIGWSLIYPHTNTAKVGTWGQTYCNTISGAIAAPDGSMTGNYVRADATLNQIHRPTRQFLVDDNVLVAYQVHAMAGEHKWICVRFFRKDASYTSVFVDLSTGNLGTTSGLYCPPTIEVVNGWWHIGIVGNILSGAGTPALQLFLSNGNGQFYFDGQYRSNTAQGGASNAITLDAGASATNNFYVGASVKQTSGAGSGEKLKITAYDGTTKIAIVESNWVNQPVNGTTFEITDGLYLWGDSLTLSDHVPEFMPTLTTGEIDGSAGGSAWFNITLATGDGGLVQKQARFVGQYNAAPSPGLNWLVSASLELR